MTAVYLVKKDILLTLFFEVLDSQISKLLYLISSTILYRVYAS
jgi:hypothetical protein